MSAHGDKGRDRFSGVVARLNGERHVMLVPVRGMVSGVMFEPFAKYPVRKQTEPFNPAAVFSDEAMRNSGGGVTEPDWNATVTIVPSATGPRFAMDVPAKDGATKRVTAMVPFEFNTPKLRSCGHPLGTTSWCPDCELAEAYRTGEFR